MAGQDVVARRVLEHYTQLLAHFRRLLHDIEARYRGAATIEAKQRRQHRNSGGLTGAVGTEQAENFAFGYIEIEVVDRDQLAEPLRQPVGLNRSHRRATQRGDLRRGVAQCLHRQHYPTNGQHQSNCEVSQRAVGPMVPYQHQHQT